MDTSKNYLCNNHVTIITYNNHCHDYHYNNENHSNSTVMSILGNEVKRDNGMEGNGRISYDILNVLYG